MKPTGVFAFLLVSVIAVTPLTQHQLGSTFTSLQPLEYSPQDEGVLDGTLRIRSQPADDLIGNLRGQDASNSMQMRDRLFRLSRGKAVIPEARDSLETDRPWLGQQALAPLRNRDTTSKTDGDHSGHSGCSRTLALDNPKIEPEGVQSAGVRSSERRTSMVKRSPSPYAQNEDSTLEASASSGAWPSGEDCLDSDACEGLATSNSFSDATEANPTACQWYNFDSDTTMVVALSAEFMGPLAYDNPYCNKQITLTYESQTVTAAVADKCHRYRCKDNDIIISTAVMNQLNPAGDKRVLKGVIYNIQVGSSTTPVQGAGSSDGSTTTTPGQDGTPGSGSSGNPDPRQGDDANTPGSHYTPPSPSKGSSESPVEPGVGSAVPHYIISPKDLPDYNSNPTMPNTAPFRIPGNKGNGGKGGTSPQ